MAIWQYMVSMIILGFILSLLLFFVYTTFWYKYKYFKKKDELIELANTKGLFEKKKSVMYAHELVLFNILQRLYGEKYYVFPQMHLSNVLTVKDDYKDHDNLWREIDHRSLDFVFFDKQTLSPLLVVELNGDSHLSHNRINRDKVFEDVFKKANLRLRFINRSETYDEVALKNELDQELAVTIPG